uniref:Uncharacterized protein n=2 Tax=Anguilla anguilla TaxID=7936 RepID=A0A0E9XWF0_ANGAN
MFTKYTGGLRFTHGLLWDVLHF